MSRRIKNKYLIFSKSERFIEFKTLLTYKYKNM
jgi:hypothetical protein